MNLPEKISLIKRENGFYYIIFEQDGKRIWRSTKTKRRSEALLKLADFKNLAQRRTRRITFSIFIEEFLEYGKSIYAKKTLEGYRYALNLLITIIGDIPIVKITPKDIDQFKTRRLRSVSPNSVNIELRFLKAAFNTAKRWEYLENNPCDKVSKVKVPEYEPVYLKREDVNRLIEIMPRWLRDITVFALHTGCRRGEILNLKWSQVDLKNRIIRIESNINFKTKHGKRRQIPMSHAVFNLLQPRLQRETSEFVFTRKGRQINGDYVQKRFKKAVREAGINDRLHFHSLRHSAASFMIQAGIPIFVVSKILGHSSVQVTRIYSHLEVENLREAVEKITFEN